MQDREITKKQPWRSKTGDEVRTSIESLVSRISANEEWLSQTFEQLVGARQPLESRDRLIWRGVVRYVNADLVHDAEAFGVVALLLHKCAPQSVWALHLRDIGEIRGDMERTGRTEQEVFQEKVRQYQPRLRALLLWLCLPQNHPELGREAIRLVESSIKNIRWEIWAENANTADENADDYYPLFYGQTIKYQTIVDPVCKFVFDQVEKFQDEEYELNRALPVRLCKRQSCGKFFLPERKRRKDYCTDHCRALDHERSEEENRDYMWVLRLENFAKKCFAKKDGFQAADLRHKLDSPKVKKRVHAMENRWQSDWPEIIERLRAVRDQAGTIRRITR